MPQIPPCVAQYVASSSDMPNRSCKNCGKPKTPFSPFAPLYSTVARNTIT